jgi:hypothetical protein
MGINVKYEDLASSSEPNIVAAKEFLLQISGAEELPLTLYDLKRKVSDRQPQHEIAGLKWILGADDETVLESLCTLTFEEPEVDDNIGRIDFYHCRSVGRLLQGSKQEHSPSSHLLLDIYYHRGYGPRDSVRQRLKTTAPESLEIYALLYKITKKLRPGDLKSWNWNVVRFLYQQVHLEKLSWNDVKAVWDVHDFAGIHDCLPTISQIANLPDSLKAALHGSTDDHDCVKRLCSAADHDETNAFMCWRLLCFCCRLWSGKDGSLSRNDGAVSMKALSLFSDSNESVESFVFAHFTHLASRIDNSGDAFIFKVVLQDWYPRHPNELDDVLAALVTASHSDEYDECGSLECIVQLLCVRRSLKKEKLAIVVDRQLLEERISPAVLSARLNDGMKLAKEKLVYKVCKLEQAKDDVEKENRELTDKIRLADAAVRKAKEELEELRSRPVLSPVDGISHDKSVVSGSRTSQSAENGQASNKWLQNLPEAVDSFEGANAIIDLVRESTLQMSDREEQTLCADPYSKDGHAVLELLQNFDDAMYDENVVPEVTLRLSAEVLEMESNQCPMKPVEVAKLCQPFESTKTAEESTGQKGVGFLSVFKLSNCPQVQSGYFNFELVSPTKPVAIDSSDNQSPTTKICLPLKNKVDLDSLCTFIDYNLRPYVLLCLKRVRKISMDLLGEQFVYEANLSLENRSASLVVNTKRYDMKAFCKEVEYMDTSDEPIPEFRRPKKGMVSLFLPFDAADRPILCGKTELFMPCACLPFGSHLFPFLMNSPAWMMQLNRDGVHADKPFNKNLRSLITQCLKEFVDTLDTKSKIELLLDPVVYAGSDFWPPLVFALNDHIESAASDVYLRNEEVIEVFEEGTITSCQQNGMTLLSGSPSQMVAWKTRGLHQLEVRHVLRHSPGPVDVKSWQSLFELCNKDMDLHTSSVKDHVAELDKLSFVTAKSKSERINMTGVKRLEHGQPIFVSCEQGDLSTFGPSVLPQSRAEKHFLQMTGAAVFLTKKETCCLLQVSLREMSYHGVLGESDMITAKDMLKVLRDILMDEPRDSHEFADEWKNIVAPTTKGFLHEVKNATFESILGQKRTYIYPPFQDYLVVDYDEGSANAWEDRIKWELFFSICGAKMCDTCVILPQGFLRCAEDSFMSELVLLSLENQGHSKRLEFLLAVDGEKIKPDSLKARFLNETEDKLLTLFPLPEIDVHPQKKELAEMLGVVCCVVPDTIVKYNKREDNTPYIKSLLDIIYMMNDNDKKHCFGELEIAVGGHERKSWKKIGDIFLSREPINAEDINDVEEYLSLAVACPGHNEDLLALAEKKLLEFPPYSRYLVLSACVSYLCQSYYTEEAPRIASKLFGNFENGDLQNVYEILEKIDHLPQNVSSESELWSSIELADTDETMQFPSDLFYVEHEYASLFVSVFDGLSPMALFPGWEKAAQILDIPTISGPKFNIKSTALSEIEWGTVGDQWRLVCLNNSSSTVTNEGIQGHITVAKDVFFVNHDEKVILVQHDTVIGAKILFAMNLETQKSELQVFSLQKWRDSVEGECEFLDFTAFSLDTKWKALPNSPLKKDWVSSMIPAKWVAKRLKKMANDRDQELEVRRQKPRRANENQSAVSSSQPASSSSAPLAVSSSQSPGSTARLSLPPTRSQQLVGSKGEQLAEQFLQRNGYENVEVLATNTKHEWDIIAEKDGIRYSFEVKSSREEFKAGKNIFLSARQAQRLDREDSPNSYFLLVDNVSDNANAKPSFFLIPWSEMPNELTERRSISVSYSYEVRLPDVSRWKQ